MAAMMNRTPLVATTSVHSDAANFNGKDAAIAITIGNIAVHTRPKALEHAAALSVVSTVMNWGTAHSTDGEEQRTVDKRRETVR